MTSKNPVTEDDVIKAANYMAAIGDMPTIAAVREYLGNRGSETTILNYLTKWKTKLLKYALVIEQSEFNYEKSRLIDALIAEKTRNIHLQEKIMRVKQDIKRMSSDDE